MRFIFSSFAVGMAFSGFSSFVIYDRFEQRKWICYKNNDDELIAYYYQQKLKEKMYKKQNKADNPTLSDLKKYINSTVVPGVLDKVDSAFALFKSVPKYETSGKDGKSDSDA